MPSAVSAFADWATGVSDDHGDEAYRRVRAGCIDTVACLVAGARDPAGIAAREAIAGWGVGAATVVGDPERRPAPWAALANGTAIDALDFDDYDVPAASHPSAVIFPALLALGEERGASGRSLLDAYIVGVEVQMRLGEALNLSHFHKGFHPTATIGTLAASVACARLLGFDAVTTGHALSIATSLAAGSKCQLGTTTIHLHTGLAAHNGVLAASLAGAGATGSGDALDGEFGTLRIMADADAPGFGGPLAKLGDPLAIVEHGLCVKPYPCCSYTTSVIDGVLSLRSEYGFASGEVDEVVARIPASHIGFLKFPQPLDELEARFSMEYCLAVALHRGAVVVADFTPAAIEQEEIRALMPKVRMEALIEPAVDDNVTVRLGDGRTLDRTVEHPRGSAALPFSEDELLAKFDSCTDGVLNPDAAAMLKQALLTLETLEDIQDLTRHLNPAR
jgi:2-methylcitrate dehydratase PrpD